MVLRSSCRATSTLPTELSLQPQIQRLQVNFILFKTSFSHWKQKWIYFYFSKWSIHCQSSTVVTAQTVCPVWSNVVTIKGLSPCPWGALLRKAAGGESWRSNTMARDNNHREANQRAHRRMSSGACAQGLGATERGAATAQRDSLARPSAGALALPGKPRGVLNVAEWLLWLLSGEQILNGTRRSQAS